MTECGSRRLLSRQQQSIDGWLSLLHSTTRSLLVSLRAITQSLLHGCLRGYTRTMAVAVDLGKCTALESTRSTSITARYEGAPWLTPHALAASPAGLTLQALAASSQAWLMLHAMSTLPAWLPLHALAASPAWPTLTLYALAASPAWLPLHSSFDVSIASLAHASHVGCTTSLAHAVCDVYIASLALAACVSSFTSLAHAARNVYIASLTTHAACDVSVVSLVLATFGGSIVCLPRRPYSPMRC